MHAPGILITIFLTRLLVAFIYGETVAFQQLEPCDGLLQTITGCHGGYQTILSIFVVGTIPGLPTMLNILIVTVSNFLLFWATLEILKKLKDLVNPLA